jgi:acyl dehydratase
MEAGANRDYAPLHYDRDYARGVGAPDAFADTPFIQAILEAGLRSWMGSGGWLELLEIRMERFNLVGTLVSAHGEVVSIEPDQDGGRVELKVWLESDRVQTVSGRAVLRLPAADR